MNYERYDGSAERQVLAALVTCDPVLGALAAKAPPGGFATRHANLVYSWCLEFYKSHKKAPGRMIESLAAAYAETCADRETLDLVEKFLSSLQEEYDSFSREANVGYLLDLATRCLDRAALERLQQQLEGALSVGDVALGRSLVESYRRLEIASSDSVDPFKEPSVVVDAFATPPESLVDYPGDMRQFFGSSLRRGGFVAFLGKDKVGKSSWLLDLAYRAWKQRRRVAYFEAGDMSQADVLRRLVSRVDGQPADTRPYLYPTSIKSVKGDPVVEREERVAPASLSAEEAAEVMAAAARDVLRSPDSHFKLTCRPTGTLSVTEIASTLDAFERDGFLVDVCVIDYSDILQTSSKKDVRDAINDNWIAMRALALARNCLVVTATQADSDSYRKDVLDMRNFSNDKRKNAHVTAIVGINQSDLDKGLGAYRLNMVTNRHDAHDPRRLVLCASCLAVANPCVRSAWA
jgi:hypothetical protein